MKIQFIVGTHPNESYSTRVAGHAARELEKQGVEVVISKFPLGETSLGSVLQRGVRITADSRLALQNQIDIMKARALTREEKPDLVFNFHCTMNPHSHWESGNFRDAEGKRDVFDFEIIHKQGMKNYPKIQIYTVEIRAQPRMFASKLLKHLDAIGAPIDVIQLSLSSSLEDTETKLGLSPRIMGREIAKTILSENLQYPQNTRIMRRIPRKIITPAQWEARIKRRAHLIDAMKKRKAARKII